MITLADKITLARLFLGPMAVAAYLFLPMQGFLCLLVCGCICGIAEATDLYDGRVARRRGEVSDFGKLADPFCDVFYRILMFMTLLLPAGGVGVQVLLYPEVANSHWYFLWSPPIYSVIPEAEYQEYSHGAGLVPVLPVILMTLREIIAGALRSMAASRGLVLAARMSGKIKAWLQGVTIITACGLPVFFGGPYAWQTWLIIAFTWVCTAVSIYSIIEYIVINKEVLKKLIVRKDYNPETDDVDQAD